MPRNVLFIVLDDIGAEKLAAFGPSEVAASVPRLDPILARSVIFDRAYAAPICGPARAAMQTGRYGFRTGFGTNINEFDTPFKLSNREVLIPERINIDRPQKYECGSFGKWHLTANTGDDLHPNDNGYDHFSGHMSNSFSPGNGTGHYDWRHIVDGSSTQVTAPPHDVTTWVASVAASDAWNWIRARTRPWFAHVAFNPPHGPYEIPPKRLLSQQTQDVLSAAGLSPGMAIGLDAPLGKRVVAYNAGIEAVAAELATLIERVESSDTLILVLGDNGTPHEVIQPPYEVTHGKRSIYEQGIRVPLFALGSGVASPGRTTSALVHAVDVFATIAAATFSAPFHTGPHVDGVSFLPLLESPFGAPPRTHVFAESFKPNGFGTPSLALRTMVATDYKLLRIGAREEFYHLAADPLETNDLLKTGMTPAQQAILEDLRQRLDATLAS
jgi:arylsulfatase B